MSGSERYQQADHFYAVKAVQALCSELRDQESTEGCLATGMLLVHHDIVNETPESEVCWTCHINMLDMLPARDVLVDSEPALFMRYQLVLARTAQAVHRMQPTWQKSAEPANWVPDHVDPECQRICGVLGLSQQLLSLIEATTILVADSTLTRIDYKMSWAALLEYQLANLHQWTVDVSGKVLDVVDQTAETYRIAAQIYLQCRFFGYVEHISVVLGEIQSVNFLLTLTQPDEITPHDSKTECKTFPHHPVSAGRRTVVHRFVSHMALFHRRGDL